MGTASRSLTGHHAALAIDPTQLAEIATSLSNNFPVCLLRRNGVPGVFGIGAAKSVPTDVQPWGKPCLLAPPVVPAPGPPARVPRASSMASTAPTMGIADSEASSVHRRPRVSNRVRLARVAVAAGLALLGSLCDRECAGQRGRCVAAEDAAVVDAVDSACRTEQRAARLSTPAARADEMAEPQRPVGIHRSARQRRGEGAAPGERVSRADPGPLPDGVGAVGHPAPRRSDVVPQGVSGSGRLGQPARAASFRRGRPDRHGLGEQQTGGAPRRWLHRVQCGHHQSRCGRRVRRS